MSSKLSFQTSRFIHFDLLKGVAIILVICGHIFTLCSKITGGSLPLKIIESLHMPLFVFISGYFASKPVDLTVRGIADYWKSKSMRLLLPLLFAPSLFDWARFGFSFRLPLRAYLTEYWFTYALFTMFVLFYLYRVVCSALRLSRGWSIAVGIISVAIVVSMCFGVEAVAPSWSSRLLLHQVRWLYGYLILGYLIAYIPKMELLVRDTRVAAVGFIIYIALLWLDFEGTPIVGGHILTLSGLIVCYYSAWSYCSRNRDTHNAHSQIISTLSWLGRISLPIYLTHYFFLISLPWVKPFLQSIEARMQVVGWEILIMSLGTLVILIPTLVVVFLIRENKYLALCFYGEEIKKKRV